MASIQERLVVKVAWWVRPALVVINPIARALSFFVSPALIMEHIGKIIAKHGVKTTFEGGK